MREEIGSEFWEIENRFGQEFDNPENNWPGEKRYFVSGRTALDSILEEILLEHTCRYAYLPSYCCHTMIEPFIRHGLEVTFYSVKYQEGRFCQKIDLESGCDIMLIMDYFGFTSDVGEVPQKTILIRDMTHALFMSGYELDGADYLFASFRKWGAAAGAAVACKNRGQWHSFAPTRNHDIYIKMRRKGYQLKKRYMNGEDISKNNFLTLFTKAEKLLEKDYVGYIADKKSQEEIARLASCIHIRRKNAEVLLDGMKQISAAEPIFPKLGKADVPLFVPIYIKNGKRDRLRSWLIQNNIYCPVHWPLSIYHTISSDEREIYECELSLICDQRYEKKEMLRQLDIIRRFEENND